MDTTICPPAHLLPFLTAKGSLTAQLEHLARQPLQVKIIKQKFRPLTFAEKRLLSLPVHRPILAWERQVLLFGNDTHAWVKASSLFPLPALQGNKKRLRHLKNTPIGYVLFKKNRQLNHERHYYIEQGQHGRKTIYEWQGQKILIQELFLARFQTVLTTRPSPTTF